MLQLIDYVVLGFYFVFLAGLGWYFHRAAGRNPSEYFRGGGRMAWWLVGATAFMGSFSAWTFTGAAGLAYDHGLVVMTIFWGNAGTYLISAVWFAPWFRQLRAVTIMEAVRQRFGRANEQVFTWMQLPMQVLVAGIWLYGLAIFLSPVFHFDLHASIVICGVIVALMSTLGGSWAVAAGDFMQTLLLVPVTLLVAWFSLRHIGGVRPLLDHLPASHFDLSARTVAGYGPLWLIALTVEKLVLANRLTGNASRFFFVADTKNARHAALLTAALFTFGSIVWFIPPLAAHALGLDLAAQFPALSSPGEAAYAATAMATLPPGLLGLLVTAIIAATLSAMDEGLNRNAGIFVRSVYVPLLRPHASEREQVRVGRGTTILMGALVILLALKYSTWRDFGVLKLMFNFVAMVGTPSGIPIFWCLLTRRGPDWVAWSTVLLGFGISATLGGVTRQAWFVDLFGHADLLARLHTNEYAVTLLTIFVVCSLWFWAAAAWTDQRDPERRRQVDAFFANRQTPVLAEETAGERRDETPRRIARLCLIYAVFLAIVALLPNSLSGRGGLGFCALFFAFIGWLLRRASPPPPPPVAAAPERAEQSLLK